MLRPAMRRAGLRWHHALLVVLLAIGVFMLAGATPALGKATTRYKGLRSTYVIQSSNLKITGALQYKSGGKWKALAKTYVRVWSLNAAGTAYVAGKRLKTSSKGKLLATFSADNQYEFVYSGSSKYKPVTTRFTAGHPWSSFRSDLAHTGRSAFRGPQTPDRGWWVRIGPYKTHSSAAIAADGTMYVGANDDNLYAINPNGTLKWAFKTGDLVWSSPSIGPDGTVYVGSWDGYLYAVRPNGAKKWAFKTGDWVISSPAIGPDGTVYVGSVDGKVYAIRPNGTQRWAFSTSGSVYASPAIGKDGTVYIGSDDNHMYAINGATGAQKWAYPAGPGADGIEGSAAIDEARGTVYYGTLGHNVIALNAKTGAFQWMFPTGNEIESSPAIGRDGTVYATSLDGSLYALSPSGALSWSFPTGDQVWASPTIDANGTIYITSHDQNVYAINPNGSNKWSFMTGNQFESSVAVGWDGTLYVGNFDGEFFALKE